MMGRDTQTIHLESVRERKVEAAMKWLELEAMGREFSSDAHNYVDWEDVNDAFAEIAVNLYGTRSNREGDDRPFDDETLQSAAYRLVQENEYPLAILSGDVEAAISHCLYRMTQEEPKAAGPERQNEVDARAWDAKRALRALAKAMEIPVDHI